MTPRVSVCIPAYRRPNLLAAAIESVVEQEYADVEVLIGDDFGDAREAVEAVGDSRIRYVHNRVRLGMAGNWSALLDAAHGRYVGLLMDDDRLLPGYLDRTVRALDDNPSVGVAFTNHFFDQGGTLHERRCRLEQGLHRDFLTSLLRYKPVPVSAALMRREVWEQVRPLPDLLTADMVMHVRAAALGWSFFYVDEPLMSYRLHQGQLSRDGARFRDDAVKLWDQFVFENPDAERLRRQRLAQALVSRAGWRLQTRAFEQGAADAARARELGPGRISLRSRLTLFFARHPRLAPPAVSLWNRLRPVSG